MNPTPAGPDRDALLQHARELRSQNRFSEALAVLARLEAAHPRFSRLFQERGHCCVLMRDASAAIAALYQAVRLNPTLPACWDMLEKLHRMRGDRRQAEAAAHNLSMLKALPRELVVANSLYADGDLEPAEAVLRDYLAKDGGNVGALRLLARVRLACDAPAEAETLLEAALELAPDYHEARLDYAMALLQRHKPLQARAQAERLLRHDPRNRAYLKQYGAACIALGDYEALVDLYGTLAGDGAASGAEAAELRVWRATALKTIGSGADAVADYHAALRAQPDYGVAWFGLANLKTYRFSDSEIARMVEAEARPGLNDTDRIYLCFALGKAYEDRADFAASWRCYERGAGLRRRTSRHAPARAEACARALKQAYTAEAFSERAGWGAPDAAPIFILGMPRSGSTLIEQILASHSQVEGTQELAEIDRYAGELCGRDPDCGLPLAPDAPLRLNASQVRALGERFLVETAAYRRTGKPFFIDKAPNNFWHIGLIRLILPRAKIIDIRRDAMACCFSNFKQLYGGTAFEFTYDIEHLARWRRSYIDLMRHWDQALPGGVLKVQYEDVVEDLEESVRRLLGYCGLGFEPACLTFHETRRSVRTPSAEQVRQPIVREGLRQWRSFAPWLGPMRDALGDLATAP